MKTQINRPLTREERTEIEELSRMFMGSSSKWQKFEKNGRSIPKKDSQGNLVVLGYNKKIRDKNGNPTPVYQMEVVRTTALELLQQLRLAKTQMEATKEAKRQVDEAKMLAAKASGTVEG